MKDYLPYAAGALAGLLVALLMSGLLGLTETPQLVLFALLLKQSAVRSLNAFAIAKPNNS
ncbi:hypothetical protein HB770_15500 [Rhizobium leguminosarum bv. viciae]|uniref:Transmembrane protein n=1 Tax=Rhizobium leguminosarum bv. viciae TaxID=387 RepID=A0A7G6RH24_RHILV|nr:hypothetical protein HB770_15500 [Rhizobium leguminosarum bv. viciae]